MAVQIFKLSLTLKAQHDRISALAILGNSGVELRKFLQTGQLVDNKPHALLTLCRLIQQAQYQPLNPQALQGAKRFTFCRERREEDPSLPLLGPLGGRPRAIRLALLREQPEAVRDQSQRAEN